jgi:hypothetical protein
VPADHAHRRALSSGRLIGAALLIVAVALGAGAVIVARANGGHGRSARTAGAPAGLVPVPAIAVGGVPAPPAVPIDRSSPLAPIVPGGVVAVAAPVGVRIPAIGVDARIVDLTSANGVLPPPTDVDTVGWYSAGPAPGDVGPALLAGHVDSRSGPAVFWRLRDLRVGDVITVQRADGTSASFTVASVAQYAKNAFPTGQVYGAQPAPVLRLVTCGGSFDSATGHYRDNLVVYADAA